VIITGGAVDRTTALTNNLIVTDVGWPVPHLIFAGIMLSTLGAGLQSLAGAPRLLAAIARDDLIPVLRPLVPPVRLIIVAYDPPFTLPPCPALLFANNCLMGSASLLGLSSLPWVGLCVIRHPPKNLISHMHLRLRKKMRDGTTASETYAPGA